MNEIQSDDPLLGARVLVVDDDAAMRALLVLRLEMAGCIAAPASTGADAKAALARGGDAAFDLILIDLCMPGPNGIETLREVRATGHSPPAVLMTAFAQPRVRAEAMALSIVVLDKPFSFEKLRSVVVELLESRRES